MCAMPSEPTELPVHALAAAIQQRALSPVELTDALLARIARYDGKLHAFVALYEKEARLAAEAADKAIRAGHAVGPLHGIPIALKDLIDLEGRVTTGGSKVWKDRISPTTATLARKLIAADRAWRGSSVGSLGIAHMAGPASDGGGQSAASASGAKE